MSCPNCNSSNLNVDGRCSCGYSFSNVQTVASGVSEYDGPLYLFISKKRLILMSILSLGLYETYWIYKNWSFVKKRMKSDIQPFWRGIFGIFYCHGLLKTIHDDPELNKIESPQFSPSTLATWWVITNILGNLVNRATNKIDNIGLQLFGLFITVLTSLTCMFFLPVQEYINEVHERLGYTEKYDFWSSGHIVCLVLGVIAWMIILGCIFLAYLWAILHGSGLI